MANIVIDPSEVDQLWTEIWHLNNDNKSDEYKGLPQKKKDQLRGLFYDLLNYHAGSSVVEATLADPEPSEDPDSAYDPEIHDPKLYPSPSGEHRRLWIPEAIQVPEGKTFGKYPKGYPEGVLWHWTAGHRNGLDAGNQLMRESPYMYLLIDKDGKIGQSNPLNEAGYHSGESSWPGLGDYVHRRIIGIEVQTGGDLKKKGTGYYTWFGEKVPDDEVTCCGARGNIQKGCYHMYTKAQCKTLRRVTLWLYFNDPSVFKIENVVGHDEVAPKRKCDPGAAYVWGGTPLTMAEVRAMLMKDVAIIKGLMARST